MSNTNPVQLHGVYDNQTGRLSKVLGPTGKEYPLLCVKGSSTAIVDFSNDAVGLTTSNALINFTRVGDVVYITAAIRFTAVGSSSGILRIGGLPYEADVANDVAPVFVTQCNGLASSVTSQLAGSLIDSTHIRLHMMNAGNLVAIQNTHLTNSSILRLSGAYRAVAAS